MVLLDYGNSRGVKYWGSLLEPTGIIGVTRAWSLNIERGLGEIKYIGVQLLDLDDLT
jgi:hypothetical protein